MSVRWTKELLVAAILLSFGILLLPVGIFVVGQGVLGDYEGGGLADLSQAIWTALLSGRLSAWLLVLSPYLVIALLRLSWKALHSR